MRHLVFALARRIDTQLAIWAPPGELPVTTTSVTSFAEAAWLKRLMSEGGISHLIRNGGIRALLAPARLLCMIAAAYRRDPTADMYHINWLQCALPLPRDKKPALITVLGNDLKLLKLPFIKQLLRRKIRQRRTVICPNADWMRLPLQKAFGDIAEIIPVSFGIDPRWYTITQNTDTPPRHRWIAVTRLTADKLGPLFEWSQEIFRNTKRELHLFGPMQEDVSVPEWVYYHGAASPNQLATEWFPGAAGLISLSRHAEGRPQVMLEAMAAGLPIVASQMPAHESFIENGVTGILCDSPASYTAALHQLEDVETRLRIGKAAREWAVREVGTWDDCAQRYTTIYKKLLGNKHIE